MKIAICVIFSILLLGLLAPFITPYDPYLVDFSKKLLSPSLAHWCGTDELGRDILTRILYGARTSFLIILLVPLIAASLGLTVGILSGYFGGICDRLLMRITDIFLAFPKLILALAFVAVLGPKLENAILAIALTSWPAYARLCRTEIQLARRADYITAARLYGISTPRLLSVFLPPIALPSLIVRIGLDMGGIVLVAASLSFLGLGAQPPTPEWGAMAAQGRDFIFQAWWISAFPGLIIVITSLAFNILGGALRTRLDPKGKDHAS